MALSTPTSNGSRRFNPLPSPSRNETPRSAGLIRPTLPQKSVTTASIDDAYVSFILYCNPAVPLETDTAALREAFRTPPKSEGKSFSTYTLFELIKQLHAKELKTWAELALKLGVEPPDHDKGQSSQKIQQYAVRLKVKYIQLIQEQRDLPAVAMDAFHAHKCLLRLSDGQPASLLDPDPE